MQRENLAGQAGRWSAAHWKLAFFGWLAFVIAAFFIGNMVGKNALLMSDSGDGESGQAEKILAAGNFKQPATEQVLIQNRRLVPLDPAYKATIDDVVARLQKLPEVTNIRSPLGSAADAKDQISADEHSAIVRFELKGKIENAADHVQSSLDATAAAQRAHPDFVIGQFGDGSGDKALNQKENDDLQKAELLAIPATLIVLVFTFGALVAASLPVLLAVGGVLAAFGLSMLASHAIAASDATQSVILLVGMAVGVDYALFYLKREREERARGQDPHRALLHTAATSGQAVLISGATVLIAVAGMLIAGDPTFKSISVGTMIVVAVAVIGSLSVLPALMHRLGDNVEKGRIPFLHRAGDAGNPRAWRAILRPVMAHPLPAVLVSGGLLFAAMLPAWHMSTKFLSFDDLPRSIPIIDSLDRVQRAFPGSTVPMIVAVRGSDVTTVQTTQAILDMRDRALATGKIGLPIEIDVNGNHTVARITMPIKSGDSRSPTAYAALSQLRKEIIPATLGTVPGLEYAVTGETAGNRDFNDLMKTHLPLVFLFVLGLAFALLLMTFRSIVIPIKAIVLNLLSVGAAYGILVLVFQSHWAQGILNFRSNGGIVSWLPLFLFVLLFGLSMDYHVFIISRIKELVDRGMPTNQAVEEGIVTTAGTVTSAAIVMVVVFAIFASLDELDLKQMGFGLAVAILIDATIVRAVLLPATMKLLGDWNWYLPRWLQWVPNLSAEPRVSDDDKAPEGVAALRPH